MPEAIHYFLGIGYIEIYQINNNVRFHCFQFLNEIRCIYPVQQFAFYDVPCWSIFIGRCHFSCDGDCIISGVYQHGNKIGSNMSGGTDYYYFQFQPSSEWMIERKGISLLTVLWIVSVPAAKASL